MSQRVAIYIRVSTEEQALQGYSIPGQREVLTNYVQAQGWDLVGEYVDEGRSAKDMNRPALESLLRDIEAGRVDALLVWRLNRLTRRLKDLTIILDQLTRNNVSLISYTERFDLSTAMGRAMLQVSGVFAELERSNLAENVRLGQRRKAMEGGWNGGIVYGYDNTPDGLKINPSEARVVDQIYEWFMAGAGAITICNRLNDQGIPTKKGGRWSVQGVFLIIDNPVYKGFVRYGQMLDWSTKRRKGKQESPLIAKGIHEPIISETMWNTVQELRQQRRAKPTKHRGNYVLSGLLRCPQCGSKMVGWHCGRNGRLFRYYKCGLFNSKGRSTCKGNYVNADRAERDVFSQLAEKLTNKGTVMELVDRWNAELASKNEPLTAELDGITRQMADIEQKMEKLIDAVENGSLPGATVKERMSKHQENLAVLAERRDQLEHELGSTQRGQADPEQVWDVLSRFYEALIRVEPHLQKQLLSAAVDYIPVTNERVVGQVILAFDPLSLLAFLVTFNDDTAPPY